MINIVTIIRLLLSVVSLLIRRADDAKQQEIGKDELIREQLAGMAVRLRIAKEIDVSVSSMSDDDIDRVLQSYYRAEGAGGDNP